MCDPIEYRMSLNCLISLEKCHWSINVITQIAWSTILILNHIPINKRSRAMMYEAYHSLKTYVWQRFYDPKTGLRIKTNILANFVYIIGFFHKCSTLCQATQEEQIDLNTNGHKPFDSNIESDVCAARRSCILAADSVNSTQQNGSYSVQSTKY